MDNLTASGSGNKVLDPTGSGSATLPMLHYLIIQKFQGSAVLSTLLQRRVAQLDESGNKSRSVKDHVHGKDKKNKVYERKIAEYRNRLLDLQELEID